MYYINLSLVSFFYSIRTPFLNTLATIITFFGEALFVIILGLIIFLILKKLKLNKYGYFLITNVILGLILTYIIKEITAIERPPLNLALVYEDNYSFPSSHTVLSITFYFSLLIILNRIKEDIKLNRILVNLIRILLIILILLIPISRLYLGVHWLSDVIGGLVIGLTQTVLLLIIFKIKLPEK